LRVGQQGIAQRELASNDVLALRHNNEASVLIESPKLAQQALIYLQHIGELSAQESVSAPERGRPSARQSRSPSA
jgi:hypothetical protein